MLEVVISLRIVVLILAIVEIILSLIFAGAYAVGWKHTSEGVGSVVGSLFGVILWILVILAVM